MLQPYSNQKMTEQTLLHIYIVVEVFSSSSGDFLLSVQKLVFGCTMYVYGNSGLENMCIIEIVINKYYFRLCQFILIRTLFVQVALPSSRSVVYYSLGIKWDGHYFFMDVTFCCVGASNQYFERSTDHLQDKSFMIRIAVWIIGYWLPDHTALYPRKQ
jgi:hypothetical protein